MNDPLEMPFDQYQRYRLVADLVDEVRGEDGPLRILDVGGRTALLRSFLPTDDVVLVDVEPSDEAGLVLGDGSALPFADRAVDAVLAFDTLEHVPPAGREAFVAECRRVAGRWVMLAGPYTAPEVDEAEELLVRFLRDKLGTRHRYLGEHRSNGLPDRAAVEAQFQAAGGKTASVGHGNVAQWLALMALSMYLDASAELRDLARQVFRYYNETIYASDRTGPVYRHVVVAAFDGARLPSERKAPSGGEGPAAPALSALTGLAFDLIGFDRMRGRWEEENRRLWSANDALRADLEGHTASLADEQAEAARRATVIDELRSEIEGHLKEALAIQKEAAEREREEAAVRLTLEKDLEAHRAEVAGLTQSLEAERGAHGSALEHGARLEERIAELEQVTADLGRGTAERDEMLGALGADLDGHRATVAALREELERTQAAAAELTAEIGAARGDIEHQNQRIAAMRAALRSRVENLKRVLGPKWDEA